MIKPIAAIYTARGDLHAYAVRDEINRRGRVRCTIIEADNIAYGSNVSYSIGLEADFDKIRTNDGDELALSDVELIWLRRIRANQLATEKAADPVHQDIINSDCRGALSGLLGTKFAGKWFSDPEASFRASDKVSQLKVAADCGLRIPRTLVSQSPTDIRSFFENEHRDIIVKAVVGVSEPFLRTIRLTDLARYSDEAFSVSPAIYQEFITGTRHLRILTFGGRSIAGIIDTTDVDWRPNLNVPIARYEVEPALQSQIDLVLKSLGLRMGVIDIKIDDRGQFVWLEVNPQGQFAFLEPLTGQSFLSELAAFFEGEALS
jgi:predicted ATP-grasp superfamily ATP-dependent carboligase